MNKRTKQPEDDSASSYTGRWVARLRGKIIAQGNSPEQVLRAAGTQRHKESPEIEFMPLPFSPLLDSVQKALPAGQEIFLVGGAVRDGLLGRASRDLDFALPVDGIKVGRRVADTLEGDFYPLDGERDTGRVILEDEGGIRTILDFAAYRGSTIDEDLRARDFTINALAVDLRSQKVYDPLSGGQDLRSKVIRACTPEAITADPVRILRGIRLAAQLGFQLDKSTRQHMQQASVRLRSVSPERLRDELFRILGGQKVSAAVRALEMLGVFPFLLPELTAMKGVEQSPPHVQDVWQHSLSVLTYMEEILAALAPGYDPESTGDLFTGLLVMRLGRYREQLADHFARALTLERSVRGLLFFAALYHDVSKPDCQQIDENGRIRFFGHEQQSTEVAVSRAKELRLSNDEIERVRLIVRHHDRLYMYAKRMANENKGPSRRAIYRFYRDAGAASIDLILLLLADVRAQRGHTLTQDTWRAALDVCRIFLENYWEKPEESVRPPQLLDGHDVMKTFELKSGPQIGEVLEAVREAQATGKVESREAAVDFIREWLEGKS